MNAYSPSEASGWECPSARQGKKTEVSLAKMTDNLDEQVHVDKDLQSTRVGRQGSGMSVMITKLG